MAAETDTFHASHRFMRMSPRKARLVMDLIRGKDVEDALTTLRFTQRRASPYIQKVLKSAVANATQMAGVEGSELVVWRAYVDDGPRQKRWKPRAQGRAYPRIRRYCHLNVVLKHVPAPQAAAGPKEKEKAQKGAAPAAPAPAKTKAPRGARRAPAPKKSARK